MNVHLVVVGKYKDPNLEAIEKKYLKQIKSPKLSIHEVKAKAEDQNFEASEVLKKIQDISRAQRSCIITLTEDGKEYNSLNFSHWLYDKIETYQHVFFLIAGAQGHGKEVKNIANASLSLSPLTFPHKIARVLFVEQFFRAMTIRNGHPYHNS